MEAPAAISRAERNRPWLAELRATLTLAWPLILANLTQQAIQATDVLLMGRLGPTQLAAATLALNLTFTFNLFMLGLITASSPMMATALGQRSNAVRDEWIEPGVLHSHCRTTKGRSFWTVKSRR